MTAKKAITNAPAIPMTMDNRRAVPKSSPPISISTKAKRARIVASMSQGLSDDCFAIVIFVCLQR